MRLLLALNEIFEDIKIHALSNIMPTKGDITRGKQKFNSTIKLNKKNWHLINIILPL